jgi:hypothetical protein
VEVPAGTVNLEVAWDRRSRAIGPGPFWNDALHPLTAEDEPPASLVEMREFAGTAAAQTGEALGLSVDVVRQDLGLAQAWLSRSVSR